MIIDISRKLNAHTPTWPGDRPFSYDLTWSKEETGSVNVGQIDQVAIQQHMLMLLSTLIRMERQSINCHLSCSLEEQKLLMFPLNG